MKGFVTIMLGAVLGLQGTEAKIFLADNEGQCHELLKEVRQVLEIL